MWVYNKWKINAKNPDWTCGMVAKVYSSARHYTVLKDGVQKALGMCDKEEVDKTPKS